VPIQPANAIADQAPASIIGEARAIRRPEADRRRSRASGDGGADGVIRRRGLSPAACRPFRPIVDNTGLPQIDQNCQKGSYCQFAVVGAFMTKVLEFRSRAEQFRQLAAQFPNQEFREIISRLAVTWENLADDRERLVPNRVANHIPPANEAGVSIDCAETRRLVQEKKENTTEPTQSESKTASAITLQEDLSDNRHSVAS
jgi:hypothetical protein